VFDWNDLRHFLAVARGRTLAGAARLLEVEHSTVSRRLAALEGALGCKLFTRTPDGLLPTEAGQELLPLAEQIEQAVAAIERRAGGGDSRVEGRVRVTTSEGFTGFLVKRLPRLRERHPELVVEVLTGNQSLDLARGEADLAVRIARTDDPTLVCRKLGVIGWALYAARGYLERHPPPPDARDLRDQEIVGYEADLSGIPGARWLEQHGAGARVVLRGNSILSALNAALAGMGIAALPCFIAEAEPTLVRVCAEGIGSRDLWLVAHPDLLRVARVRAVMDFLVEIAAEAAGTLAGAA
jgi:DNA-binding transcriptional LysR family regulator